MGAMVEVGMAECDPRLELLAGRVTIVSRSKVPVSAECYTCVTPACRGATGHGRHLGSERARRHLVPPTPLLRRWETPPTSTNIHLPLVKHAFVRYARAPPPPRSQSAVIDITCVGVSLTDGLWAAVGWTDGGRSTLIRRRQINEEISRAAR